CSVARRTRLDVCAPIHRATFDLLGGDVVDRAGEGTFATQAVDGGGVLWEPEVGEERAIVLLDEDVARFHVTVYEPLGVCGVERLRDGRADSDRACRLPAPVALEDSTKVCASDVPHREVELAVCLARCVDRDNAGVLEMRGQTGFTEEARAEALIAGELRRQQLECHRAVEVLVNGKVNRTGATLTEHALDSVAGHSRAGCHLARHAHLYHRDGSDGTRLPSLQDRSRANRASADPSWTSTSPRPTSANGALAEGSPT